MVPENILKEYGASVKTLQKGEILFQEGDEALYYYQIIEGEIKMLNWTDDGKEFIQGIFGEGQSFGEPALFGKFPYPASTVASKPTVLYKLSSVQLEELLKNHFEVHLNFTRVLSKRLQYKSMMMKEISGQDAEHQLITLIKYLKKQSGIRDLFELKLTRQNMADLTGLRVETVIRTIKTMVEQGKLTAKGRKIYY
jgi:CRP/FNR family transcriptional regulator, cyclic AMP receptor protein